MEIALDPGQRSPPVELSRAECMELLRGTRIARVVLSVNCIPIALPVNVSVLDEDLVFGTQSSSVLTSSVHGQVVSMEADEIDLESCKGWSVLVTGIAQLVTEFSEIERAGSRLHTWVGGNNSLLVRVPSTLISGRSLTWGTLQVPEDGRDDG